MRVNSTYLSTEKEKVSKFCEQCANWQPRYDIRHEMPLHVSKSKRCDTLILRICQSGCRIFIISKLAPLSSRPVCTVFLLLRSFVVSGNARSLKEWKLVVAWQKEHELPRIYIFQAPCHFRFRITIAIGNSNRGQVAIAIISLHGEIVVVHP